MRYQHLAAAAALAGLANAQSQCLPLVTSIPPCALGYIAEIAFSSFTCDIVDFDCQCKNLGSLINPVSSALNTLSSCPFASVAGPAANLCQCHSNNAAAPQVTLNSLQKQCEPSAVAIPPCALGFLASAGVVDGCQINDFACQCSNFDAINTAIASEVSNFCGSAGVSIDDVRNSASSLCACVSGGGGGGNPSPSATTTPGSSPGPSSSPSPQSAPTGSPAPSGTAPKANSSPGAPPLSSSKTGGSAPGSSSKAGTNPSVSSPKPTNIGGGGGALPTFTGAGATMTVFGGFFGVVAGLAAFL